MKNPKRRGALLLAALMALLVTALLWLHHTDGDFLTGGGDATGAADEEVAFTISGDLSKKVAPDVTVPLDLSFDNPNDVDILIDRVEVTLVSIDAPRANAGRPCSLIDFEVRQIAPELAFRISDQDASALSTMRVATSDWPAVGMRNRAVNQDGCKGASLTLSYVARGLRVDP